MFGCAELCSEQQFPLAWRLFGLAQQRGICPSHRAMRSLLVCANKVS